MGISVKDPPVIMARAKFFMTGAACRWRYRSISSDLQRPRRRMTSVSTFAQSSAFAPAARRHRALTSVGRKPRDAGDKYLTASRSVLEMAEGVILTQRFPLWTRARGLFGAARDCRRCRTRRTRAFTGHRLGLPLRPRPMTSPRTPFFWSVKVRLTKVAALSWASVAWTRSKRWGPKNI